VSGLCFVIVSIVAVRVRCRLIYGLLIVDSAEYRSGIELSVEGHEGIGFGAKMLLMQMMVNLSWCCLI
jgi:hypothetical protein